MAGAEEEEDYMGDLSQFLPPESSQPSSKKVLLLFIHSLHLINSH